VRELQNLLERAVILTRAEILELADFELPGLAVPPSKAEPADERQRIEEALRAARGRVAGLDGAAASLGVAPSTLESRIHRLGIDKFAFRPGAGTTRVVVPLLDSWIRHARDPWPTKAWKQHWSRLARWLQGSSWALRPVLAN
jgi:hypothetical protein